MLFPNHMQVGDSNIYRYDIVKFNQNSLTWLNFLRKMQSLRKTLIFYIHYIEHLQCRVYLV